MSEIHRYGIHRVTEMVPWQESWESTFIEEKNLIVDAMTQSGLVCNVYHVGSTSVKGMISKPIIDILLCPERNTDLVTFIPVLEQIGYSNLGECGRPGRYSCPKATTRIIPSICIFAMRITRWPSTRSSFGS